VFAEISAAFWDYPGQVLRSFAVAAEPTPLYAELHAVASADTRIGPRRKLRPTTAEPGARHACAHGDREPRPESDKGDVHEF